MLISPAPLAPTVATLRSGQLDLLTYIDEVCNRIDAAEPLIHALLPEQDRRQRLLTEAGALQKRFPEPASRPPLYGVLLGVKDIFRVAGFPTQAGSQLPAELFDGPEAACVTLLRNAGALILGKTISAEFAWIEPGPTRNPHNLDTLPVGRAVVRLQRWLLASVLWGWAHKPSAPLSVPPPFVALSGLNQPMDVFLRPV